MVDYMSRAVTKLVRQLDDGHTVTDAKYVAASSQPLFLRQCSTVYEVHGLFMRYQTFFMNRSFRAADAV